MARVIVARLLLQSLTGAVLGGIIGAIVTGDFVYNIVWGVGLAVLFLTAGLVGARHAKAEQAAAPTPRPQGIIQRMTGVRVAGSAAAAAVLNPPPSSRPSARTILNGEPLPEDDNAMREMGRVHDRPPIPLWRRLAALLVILAVAALVLLPAYRTIGWIAGDLAQGRWDGRDPRTGIHQEEMVADLAAVAGGAEFTRIAFYDGYVLADAPTTPGADTTDSFTWRYGRAWREGPELIQPDDLDAELFDAAALDFSVVGEVTRAAIADTGWPSFESYFSTVYRNPADPASGPVIVINLTSPYYSATYTYSTAGELVSKTGTGID